MANYTNIKSNKFRAMVRLYNEGVEEDYIIINTFDTEKGKVAVIAQKKPQNDINIVNCYEKNLNKVMDRTGDFE